MIARPDPPWEYRHVGRGGTDDERGLSDRSRLVALLLCLVIGGLGIHRFYVGKVGRGILMILTMGGLGIWVIVDLILIITGSFRDADGKIVFVWMEPGSV